MLKVYSGSESWELPFLFITVGALLSQKCFTFRIFQILIFFFPSHSSEPQFGYGLKAEKAKHGSYYVFTNINHLRPNRHLTEVSALCWGSECGEKCFQGRNIFC